MPAGSRVFVVVGTRPEVVKMTPVIRALQRRRALTVSLCELAQQSDMLRQALAEQNLRPDYRVAAPPGPLLQPTLVASLVRTMRRSGTAIVLVQGDTAAALAGAVAASRAGMALCHVEAGLRTGDLADPFPEELHRRLIGRFASRHYAPTEHARANLLSEGVPDARIVVTGNTVVDTLAESVGLPAGPRSPDESRRLVVVTLHRRESFGQPIRAICRGIRRVVATRRDVEVVLVLHSNPGARCAAIDELRGAPRTELREPMDHQSFLALMRRAHVIVTDSGGIQEEAPYLGVPVLVARDRTERIEALRAGAARLVGRNEDGVAQALGLLLDDTDAHARMARVTSPFGPPGGGEVIAADLERRLALRKAV